MPRPRTRDISVHSYRDGLIIIKRQSASAEPDIGHFGAAGGLEGHLAASAEI